MALAWLEIVLPQRLLLFQAGALPVNLYLFLR
jgi:hypothetical protein